jgi:hypothetical protein
MLYVIKKRLSIWYMQEFSDANKLQEHHKGRHFAAT